ncbi:DUF6069 family protein [Ferrimicrobium sp.]|uniref:DUF6069 family protein n=1 Tax=Ferrimicrobium sp. TaxID=2926050 RepID=UPI0026051D83|nr:DUF6069 family protein [Ferrimicrobium sp.]
MTIVANHEKVSSPIKMRIFAVHNAVAAAVLAWVVEVHLFGVHLGIRFGTGTPTTLSLGQIIGVSLMASLLGWALLSFMERRVARAATLWTVAAIGVVLLSLALPLTATTSTAAMVGLIVMHLLVGAGSIPLMYRSTLATPVRRAQD